MFVNVKPLCQIYLYSALKTIKAVQSALQFSQKLLQTQESPEINCVPFGCTNQKVVLNYTEGQPIVHVGDAAEHGSTLTSKALCVDDTAPCLTGHHIKPTKK